MKRFLAALLLLVALPASADWPQSGLFIDARNYSSIQAAVNACGKGGTNNDIGCIVQLPRGLVTLTSTLQIGSGTGDTDLTNFQSAVSLRGWGAGNVQTGVRLCGTTIKWGGANGGTMIQISGPHMSVQDVCIDGSNEAGYGIKFVAKNSIGAITTEGNVERVRIENVLDTTNASTGWAISLEGATGANDNDQMDLMKFDQVGIYNNRHCIRQISGQAFLNRFRNIYCSSWTVSPGINLQLGQAHFDTYFMNPGVASGVGIDVGTCAISTTFNNGDWEWDTDAGTLFNFNTGGLCAGGGGAGNGNEYPSAITNNFVQLQSDGSPVQPTAVINMKRRTNLIVSGNTFRSDDAALGYAMVFDNPDATIQSTAVFSGNDYQQATFASESEPAFTVTSTGGGGMTVIRHERGRYEMITPQGVQASVNNYITATASSSAISNTVTETAFSNCDDIVLPANYATAGTTLRLTAGGVLSSAAAAPGTLTFRVRWGTVNTDPLLVDLGPSPTLATSLSNDGWRVQADVVIRTIGGTGTAVGGGTGTLASSTADASSVSLNDQQGSGTTTIATNAAKTPTLFALWSAASASNTITADFCHWEVLRQ